MCMQVFQGTKVPIENYSFFVWEDFREGQQQVIFKVLFQELTILFFVKVCT